MYLIALPLFIIAEVAKDGFRICGEVCFENRTCRGMKETIGEAYEGFEDEEVTPQDQA